MFKRPHWCKTETCKYTFLGVLFGFFFPILAIAIDLIRLDLDFSLENIYFLHQNTPLHYIIESAPVFLGIMAYFIGKAMDKVSKKNKQLLETSKYKDHFLASMSHEIRTPMAGILGVVDLFEQNLSLGNKERKYVDIIKRSSNDLMHIINDILDLTKLRLGKVVITKSIINVQQCAKHIKNLFLATSKAHDIDFVVAIAKDVPEFLEFDDVRVKQILMNLVGNAHRHSKGSKITLKVSLVENLETEDVIKFEVIDNGVGIDKNRLNSIFNAYELIEKTNESDTEGLGLGLHISTNLVKLMEGAMGVESELDKGSNFWFTIQSKKVTGVVGTKKNKAPLSEKKFESLNLNVLIVDDNKVLCTLFKGMLKKLGCTTDVAYDGIELKESFNEEEYDAILLDINMPILDGIKTLAYLRENFKNLPPIICATAGALNGDVDKYMDAGFDDYIFKPFRLEQLYDTLKKWQPIIRKKKY